MAPSDESATKRRKVEPERGKDTRPIRSGLSSKSRPEPEPVDPPEAHAPAHATHDPAALVWTKRSDVGTLTGDVYQVRFTEEAYDKYFEERDPTKRSGKIARKMRIRTGIEVPAKAELATAFKIDFETFWRKLEGVSLVGSRGKTIEEVANDEGE